MAQYLVVGAAVLDRPVWLDAPLQPGRRLRGGSLLGRLGGRLGGGAANASVALARAGHEPLLAAAVSDDASGEQVLSELAAAGVDLRLVTRRTQTQGQTLILIAPGGERMILGLDSQPVDPVRLPDSAQHPDIRLAGVFLRGASLGAESWLQQVSGPIVLHQPLALHPGVADVIVASADDLDPRALLDPFGFMLRQLGPDMAERLSWVVVTKGSQGATAHGPGGLIEARAPAARVVDATGAGDVFAAGLMEALSAGASMRDALDHACLWGAAAVELDGSAPTSAPAGAFAPFGQGRPF